MTRTDQTGLAMALTVTTVLVFGVQDALSKLLVAEYSPFQIAMMRYWGFAAFALVVVVRRAGLARALHSKAPRRQVLRGVLLIADIWFFALALQAVPLAELQAISLVYPLLVTVFVIPVLGEKVGPFRLGAVLAGFIGALVIVRPGGLPLDLGVGYAVLSAAFYALYIVFTRQVSAHDTTSTSMAYVALVGLVLSSAVGVFFWQDMAFGDFGLMVVVMGTTCVGHGLMMLALSKAPASVLQPFNYFALPWAIVLSVLVFDHLIDPVSLVGAGVIVVAGLVVMARERRRTAVPPAAAQGKP